MKIQCSHIPRLMIECKIQNGKTKFTGDNDNVKIIEVTSRTPDLIDRLLTVWEDSVRATHLFLSDNEIKRIKEYVPQALSGVAHLVIA